MHLADRTGRVEQVCTGDLSVESGDGDVGLLERRESLR